MKCSYCKAEDSRYCNCGEYVRFNAIEKKIKSIEEFMIALAMRIDKIERKKEERNV
jgi:hypothetical protein